jgi:hypothetical protein
VLCGSLPSLFAAVPLVYVRISVLVGQDSGGVLYPAQSSGENHCKQMQGAFEDRVQPII